MKFSITLILILTCLSLVMAQDGRSAAAARAARLDALRQLGETIQGVRIDGSTTVKDFITQNDNIKAQFEGLIQGATQVGNVVYNNDGTCEVTLEINMDQLIYWMRTMTYQYTHGDPRKHDNIPYYNNQKIFRATGSGAIAEPTQPQPLPPQPMPNDNYYTPDTSYNPPPPYNPQQQYNPQPTPEPSYNPSNSFDWSYVTGQGKLMAKRAAIVDAYRNLGEVIQGVRIDARTIVRDFVTERDEIRAAFNGTVQGAQIVGEPRYAPDGVVEVTAQIDMNFLINSLQGISRKYNSRIPPQKFSGMQQYYPSQIIKATGSGAVDRKYIRAMPTPVAPVQPVQPVAPVAPPRPYVPEWANRTVKVTGNGAYPMNIQHPGQARLMAERAAVVDAYRLLIEQVYGLRLQSQTTVQDFITTDDTIKTKVDNYVRGQKITAIRNNNDGTVEADVELWLGHVWELIEAAYRRQK